MSVPESQKWKSCGGLSVGKGRGEMGEKKHKWQEENRQGYHFLAFWLRSSENRQGQVKNSMGNGEAKELICMTHGHELRWGMMVGGGMQGRGEKMGQL